MTRGGRRRVGLAKNHLLSVSHLVRAKDHIFEAQLIVMLDAIAPVIAELGDLGVIARKQTKERP